MSKKSYLSETSLIALGLYALALIFRMINIGQEIFFVDEEATLKAIGGSFRECYEFVREVEANPPLYFFLVKAWSLVFGLSRVAVRSFSAFAGSFAPVFIYLAARQMRCSQSSSIFAGLFLAVSPLLVWWGQQARVYALLVSVIAFWIYALARTRNDPRRPSLALLASSVILGFSLHYLFAVAVLGGIAVLFIDFMFHLRDRSLRNLMFVHIGACLTWLAYIPLARYQIFVNPHGNNSRFVPRPEIWDFFAMYHRMFPLGPLTGHSTISRLCLGLFFLLVAAAGVSVAIKHFRSRKSEREATDTGWGTFLFVSAFLPVFALYQASIEGTKYFVMDRYPMMALPAFALWVAYVAGKFPAVRFRFPLTLALALLWIPLGLRSDITYWRAPQEFDWRGAIDLIGREWEEGDAIVFFPGWMADRYISNGGDKEELIGGDDQLEQIEARNPVRIWVFGWEQNPRALDQRKYKELKESFGSEIAYHGLAIVLWKVPRGP